jgi:aspartyl protease family protein
LADRVRSVLVRLVIFAGVIAFLAVLAPKVAPTLIAGIADNAESDVVPEPVEPPVAPIEDPAPRKRENPRQVALDADPRGHFLANARINGTSVEVMVDTGASVVALNADTARRLNIYLTKSDFTRSIRTASGVVAVAPVTLKEVRLGNVTVRNVEAAILPGEALETNLLGMSFLNRLSRFEVDGGELVLTQ